jgi:alpha-tubulin suppressor-like RCC1 family protein
LVYGWGYNKHGQLGLDDDKDRNVPVLLEKVLD